MKEHLYIGRCLHCIANLFKLIRDCLMGANQFFSDLDDNNNIDFLSFLLPDEFKNRRINFVIAF